MTKRKTTNTKKNKTVKPTQKEKTLSTAVNAESEDQSVEESPAKTASTENAQKTKAVKEPRKEPLKAEAVEETIPEEPVPEVYTTPRRSVAFIGSECYPFVKTGGLGDVMYALPKALIKQNCDVKVILPR